MSERGATPAEDDALGCYEEGQITKLTAPAEPDGVWSISYGDHWGIGLAFPDRTPRVGDHLRVYGRFGRPVHGWALNGTVVRYKSEAEMQAEHQKWCDDLDAQRHAEFDAQRDRLDADFDSLPPVLQKRITRFREANPDFRWKHESYEMFVCTQAALLAAWCEDQPDPAAALDVDPSPDTVPGWSDGHSGNTHGCARALARTLVGKRFPEAAAVMPAALAPLVGTADLSEPEPVR